MLLLLCFALAYAIQGAATRAWSDGSAAAYNGYRRTRQRWGSAVKQGRASDSRAVRWTTICGQGAVAATGGLARVLWGTGRALWCGGRDGWIEGRSRGVRRWARRRVARRRLRAERERAAHDALWGAPAPEPVAAAPDPDPEPPTPPPTAEPSSPPPVAVSPPPLRSVPPPWQGSTPKETDMPVPTGEVTDLPTALHHIGEIHAQGTTYLDTAAAAAQEADDLTRAAERLEARLSAAQMDDASRGAVARMKERAAALSTHAAALASLADGMVGSCNDATEAVSAWLPVAERMRALGATPDSTFVAGNMAQRAAV